MNFYFLILAYASLFALGLSDNLRGPLFAEILKDLKIDDFYGSMFFGVASTCGFLGSYLSRFLLRTLNPLIFLRCCLLGLAFSMWGSAFSQNFVQLVLCQIVLGGSLGAMGVVQNLLAKEGSSAEKRSQSFAGLHSMYGLASLLAPLLVSLVYSAEGTWRSAFVFGSFIPLAVVAMTFLGFKEERKHPQLNLKRVQKVSVNHSLQIFAAVALGFYVVSEIVIGSRLVLFLNRDFNFSLIEANQRLTLYFLLLFVGRVFFSLKKIPLRLPVQIHLLVGSTLLLFVLGLWVDPLFLSICGLSMSGVYPLIISRFSHIFNDTMESLLSYCFTFSSGFVVLMHFSVGHLTQTYGIHKALCLGVASLFLAWVLYWIFESKVAPKNHR